MLKRQALWVPAVKHNPAFVDYFHRFLVGNPITSLSVAALRIKPEEIQVALEPNSRRPGTMVTSMMAFPATIDASACDTALLANGEQRQQLSFGLATAVCDSCNSFHVMERLIPQMTPHVSVNIQSQCIAPLRAGDAVVVVSTIEKMGKRLVYCKSEFLVEKPSSAVTAAMIKAEAELSTIAELQASLMQYDKAISGTHVKSILSGSKA